ncbi:substrate-binding periplasmic protein [Bdellovibrio svalbardensis]|uniref:Transporter substrate-binding domain-containing protein n=1 Tax=Bdellovibrio svalbardensis TaxID=2972972 RepID=A0ABT6DL38_9BACT|nr:transporter substrate-binding domain-containing protein [Bdellovibrio svalbardensis]MDG0815838.1 transporter substrate-binding domain-containing protein [Bdellovibrio svalbardensis]
MTKKVAKILAALSIFIGCALSAFFYSAPQPDDAFIFAGWNIEPFYYKGPQGIQGAYYDIMVEVCRTENLRCTFKISEFRKSIDQLKKGETHGGGPYVFTVPRSSVLSFSEGIFSSTYAFFGLPKTAAEIISYEDLRGYKIGTLVLSGTRVSLEAVNEFVDGTLTIKEEKSVSSLMQKIDSRQYPLGYINRDGGISWIAKNHSKIVEIPNLSENLDYRFAFSKKAIPPEKMKSLLEAFPKLRKSGFLKSIALKYKLNLTELGRHP